MAEAEAEAKSIKTRILIYNIGSVIKTKAWHRINVLRKLKQHNGKSLQTIYRGDRGKMIHFFKIFFSCFYDWIYFIAFKCILHCQVLATT